jgi:hypothetical protein
MTQSAPRTAGLTVDLLAPPFPFAEQSFAVPKAAGVHRHRRGPLLFFDATMRKRQQQASEQPGDRERPNSDIGRIIRLPRRRGREASAGFRGRAP